MKPQMKIIINKLLIIKLKAKHNNKRAQRLHRKQSNLINVYLSCKFFQISIMKNILLTLFILIPFISIASKYYPGKAVKTDGTELIGYFQFPDHSMVKTIKYKSSLESKNEKLKSKNLQSIEITNNNDTVITYEMRFSKGYKLFGGKKMKRSKKASWFKLLEKNENGISVYSGEVKSSNPDGQFATTSYTSFTYILFPKDKDVIMIELQNTQKLIAKMNFYKAFVKKVEVYFEDICPEISSHITKELYKEKGVFLLPELYEQHCK
ncbi:hypothetical protein BBFL7_01556 [Flavobacteria bacterium BBFL7]|nr:hypothetical protein BBFL7_01556 [Flavobacteria bacterium BBFL7]